MNQMKDRMRLKDRILANAGKAIKSIQECQSCYDGSVVEMTDADWQCNKLCEHFDHALLHGLRHVTNGYWRVVTEFTRKGAVREIKNLHHVTTDLGRGRAWLCMALNESLLESYLRCFMENISFVKKYYSRDALVLDEQRLHVLVTLSSGLDFATFKLDYDVPYLDLSTHPPRSRTSSAATAEQNEDKVSLCSMESVASRASHSGTTGSTPDSQGTADSDCASTASSDVVGVYSDSSRRAYSVDSGYQVEILKKKRSSDSPSNVLRESPTPFDQDNRIQRIQGIVREAPAHADDDPELEIVHVKSKVGKLKKRKSKKTMKIKENNLLENPDEDCAHYVVHTLDENHVSDLANDSSGDQLGPRVEGTPNMTLLDRSPGDGKESPGDNGLEKNNNIGNITIFSDEEIFRGNKNANPVMTSQSICKENEIKLNDTSKNDLGMHSDTDSLDNTPSPAGGNEMLRKLMELENTKHSVQDRVSPYSHDSSLDDSIHDNGGQMESGSTHEDDMYSINNYHDDEEPVTYHDILDPNANQEEHNPSQDIDDANMKEQLDDATDESSVPMTALIEADATHPWEIKVDNNSMLYLMLDVFENEDEQYLKMFSTRTGHTEGETTHIFMLITDRAVYFLKQKESDRKFSKEEAVLYTELDYISLSICKQVIQVVCTNRRKQFWVTTGDEYLTDCIMTSMSDAIKRSTCKLPRLTVLTDATTQKIALKKYIAMECNCAASEVEIEQYRLVHWDDSRSAAGHMDTASKEGHLLYKSYDSYFTGQNWKPVYVILRDGIMCMFSDKNSSKPTSFVHLNPEGCVGCRRCPQSDRPNSFEIIHTTGETWQISAATEKEANDWLQSLCQAVAEGIQPGSSKAVSSLPCCIVLTEQKLLMCHEDMQTGFYRTLGSANVLDVTAVAMDTETPTVCILEFEAQEAGISSEQWALHFNSYLEKEKFTHALSTCWAKHFLVEIPVNNIEDLALQSRCHDVYETLRSGLCLKS